MEPRANAPVASLRGWLCVQYTVHYDYSWKFSDFSRIYPIIPEYSLILLTTYYARNYAGIIDACLVMSSHSLGVCFNQYISLPPVRI